MHFFVKPKTTFLFIFMKKAQLDKVKKKKKKTKVEESDKAIKSRIKSIKRLAFAEFPGLFLLGFRKFVVH